MEENRIEEDLISDEAEVLTESSAEELENEAVPVGESGRDEREEYELLIKNRFKDFYAEDTQRLINRRFRKYKVMEERFKIMEESLAEKEARLGENAAVIAGFDERLKAEIERAIKETEERVIGEIKAKRLRPDENGASPRKSSTPFDVSKLSKSERASLAKRAAGGEKIKF
jgi:hypothetical protein